MLLVLATGLLATLNPRGLDLRAQAALAAALALAIWLVAGRRFVAWLARHCPEPNKSPSDDLRALNAQRPPTPTMGGLLLVVSVLAPLAMVRGLDAPALPAIVVAVAGLAAVGAVDDLIKLRSSRRGLGARAKLVAQGVVALAAAAALIQPAQAASPTALELTSRGAAFVPWAALVIVASANAVNLTDGLDGLAGGCFLAAAAALGLAAYARGGEQGDVCVLLAAAAAGTLALLSFNCHPAAVFMGNVGSQSLGAVLGVAAVAARLEWLLLVAGGVFVVEALSVIVQVVSFRTRGRRVFRCAPLHHHFQLLGWPQRTIVARFWLAAALCAGIGVVEFGSWNSEVGTGRTRIAEAERPKAPSQRP